MKKMKWVALVALTLAAVMALSSCALFGGKKGDVTKMLDEDVTYVDNTVLYANASKVDALTGKYVGYAGYPSYLVYFTDTVEKNGIPYTQHTVYNLKTNTAVYTVDDTATSRAKVTLDYTYVDGERYAFFLITTASWNVDGDGDMVGRYTIRTELYDSTGTRVAGVSAPNAFYLDDFDEDKIPQPTLDEDLLYFNGIYYRFGEDGKLNRAFEYSQLADLPNLVDHNAEYYVAYEEDGCRVVFYDRDLKEVAAYQLPTFEVEDIIFALMRNGKLLVQYYYELPADAKKYDFVEEKSFENGYSELRKYDLVTLVVDAKNGKAKEVKCDYLVEVWGTQYDENDDNLVLDLEKIEAYGSANKIENGRISEQDVWVTFDKKANISEITYNGEKVWDVALISDSRIVVETEAHDYLLDREGNLIGKIDNAEGFGKYLLCGEKVYDYDLNVKLDLYERNFKLYESLDEYLLLENADGDILLYTGEGDPTVIVEDDSDYYLYDTYDDFYVIVKENDEGDDEYEIYNAKGTLITKIDKITYSSLSVVASIDEAILLRTTQKIDGVSENIFYRLTK